MKLVGDWGRRNRNGLRLTTSLAMHRHCRVWRCVAGCGVPITRTAQAKDLGGAPRAYGRNMAASTGRADRVPALYVRSL